MAELIIRSILIGSIYALLAMAFNLVFAGARVINFAQGDLVAAAGMVLATATVSHGLPYGVGVVLACVIVSGIGLVIVGALVLPTLPGVLDRTVNEQAQLRWVLTTIGASVTIEAVANIVNPSGPVQVAPPLSGSFDLAGANVPWYDVLVVGVSVTLIAGVYVVVNVTDFGRRLRAVAGDRYGAEVVGIPARQFFVVLFCGAGLLSAVAGALIVPVTQADANSGFALGIAGFAAATIGGLGDLRGSLLGGLLIGFAELFGGRYINSQLESIYPLMLLLVVLMVRPRGLLQSAFVERV